jgi:hypothetical protein
MLLKDSKETYMEPIHLKRLAFIKYFFYIGLHQSYQPEPLCGIAILSFHDSVELFLQLCLDELSINVNEKKSERLTFMDYWGKIEEKGKKLSRKTSMNRINTARNGFKHHGNIPSKLDIETFRATTNDFFTENCITIFNIDFNDVSLIDAIKFDRTRETLKQAKLNFETGKKIEYSRDIILSFRYLLLDYEQSKIDRFDQSPFFSGKFIPKPPDQFLKSSEDNILKKWAGEVEESFKEIQEALKILFLGIDYRKYVKYRSIVPPVAVNLSVDGKSYEAIVLGDISLKKQDLDFCIDFIIESSLKLQEFD